MIRRKRNEMQVSNAELVSMTQTMDDLHRDESLPNLQLVVSQWCEAITDEREANSEPVRGTSRRQFMIGAGGLAVAGGLLAACGSSNSSSTTTTMLPTHSTRTPSTLSSDDAGGLAVDASIENLAIFAYTAGIAAAKAGKLGKVPPAVPVFAETALSHHKDHLAAFNSVLTTAGLKAVTAPDPVLTPTVQKDFAKVTDVTGLAELAILLENTAAQSYQDDAASFSNLNARQTSATIQPVEMTHAAILYFVLGKYPGVQTSSGAPVSFSPLTLSRPNSDMKTT